jgi:sirohydrochlorin ferrochelatase
MPFLVKTASRIGVLLASSFLAAPSWLPAQTGVLVVAHGGGQVWNAGVRAVVEQVRWTEGPVATAFLMGPEAVTSGWDAGLAKLVSEGARQVIVVPLLISSHGGHYYQIRFYAGELAELPSELAAHGHPARPSPVPLQVTPALDAAPELADALAERWRALDGVNRRRPLLLVAHGPDSDSEAERWTSNLDSVAARIRQEGNVSVSVGLLRDDAAPPVRAAAVALIRSTVEQLATAAGDSVAVLPVLISMGEINRVTIPKDLSGLPIRYTPVSLAPSPALARWIERSALARAAVSR